MVVCLLQQHLAKPQGFLALEPQDYMKEDLAAAPHDHPQLTLLLDSDWVIY